MTDAIAWWFILQLIGLVGFPLAYLVFRRLPDGGYAFAKPFGLLFLSYLFWILVNARVLPNTTRGEAWALFILALPAGWVLWRHRDELLAWAVRRWRYILAVESLFTFAFAVALYLRSYVPDIAGTEKPMDFMFMNALVRSEGFPPADPWLAGENVSYYYFGHLLVVTVARLAAVPTAVAFNLGLGMIAALAVVASFGLVFNLVALRMKARGPAEQDEALPRRPLVFGLVAALLVTVVSNLEGVLELMAAHGVGNADFYSWVGIANLDANKTTDAWYPTEHWFWWRATRIIPDAGGQSISEFPFFSFLLGDLHPHVMSIPFIFLVMGLGLALLQRGEPLDGQFWLRSPFLLAAAAVMVGGLFFLNTWDLPTFGFLLIVLAFLANMLKAHPLLADRPRRPAASGGTTGHGGGKRSSHDVPAWRPLGPALVATAAFAVPLVIAALLAYSPVFVSFSTQAGGFAAVTNAYTRPLHAFLFWGPLVVAILPFLWQRLASAEGPRPTDTHVAMALAPGAGVLVVWALWVLFQGDNLGDAIADRKSGWLTALGLIALLACCILALWRELSLKVNAPRTKESEARRTPDLLALSAGAVAVLLILGTEFFRVKDVFDPARLNTVFKLYYQAWLLLAVVGGYGLFRLAESFSGRAWGPLVWRRAWAGMVSLVLVAALVYPVTATYNRTNDFNGPRTLDGLAFAKQRNRGEIQALEWLIEHAEPDAVVVEAVGGSYSEAGRVSAWTGLQTPIGWPGHESQWRCRPGSPCRILAGRFEDVERLYQSTDEAEIRSILDKYDVSFVFVGSLERQKYAGGALGVFERMMPVAYQQGDVVIYRAGGLAATSPEGGP